MPKPAKFGIGELLRDRARLTPAAPVLLAPDRVPMTYSALLNQVEGVAAVLNGHGIGRSDRVAVVLPNGAEMAACFLSVAVSAVCAPLNPTYRAGEFDVYFDSVKPKALIVTAGLASPAREIADKRGVRIVELVPHVDQAAGVFALSHSHMRDAMSGSTAQPSDAALVLHTSGTTARPKMVPLTHANLCTSAANIAEALALTAADRCLGVMPLFHIHGLVGALLSTIYAGGSLACMPDFQAPLFFDWLERFHPTWYTAAPTIHRAVLARAAQLRWPISHTSLRLIRSCSAALPPRVMAELETLFGVPVVEAYGMTEASHQIACAPLPPRERKPGSVGVAAGTRVAIRDGDGTFPGPDRIGEIVVRGEGVTTGYANSPEANAEAFSDGWFRTGDQGFIDKEGYIFITGRTKEIINRGGTKISPREIDEMLMEHPAVAEAVAFAVPDPRLGEDVGAAIVLRQGASIDERELRNFAATGLADFKLPRWIVFLHEIPKGPTGKPQRIGLAAKLGIGQQAKEALPFVAPGTPIEMELAAMWRRTLRIERIGIHENFFDGGGDSLSGVSLLAEIEQVTGVQLQIGDLFDAPTIGRLALLLADNTRSRERRDLIAIQPAGSRPPFFCIFAGPLFRDLALRLGPDQPFLSPQYPALDKLPHPCSLEDIAAAHVETIRAAQREGPYFLGGWCVDGVVAYEVARQLRAQGQQVGLIVMFDVPNPTLAKRASKMRSMAAACRRLAWRLRRHLLGLRRHRWKEAPAYILVRVPGIVAMVKRKGVQLNYMIRLRLGMAAIARDERAILYRAAALYRPGPYDGRILMLRRTLRHHGEDAEDSSWDELALGGFDVQEIPGDHLDMFLDPHVAITARKLGASLRDAQGDLVSEASAVGFAPESERVSGSVA